MGSTSLLVNKQPLAPNDHFNFWYTLDSIYGPDRPDGGLTVKIGLTFTAVHEEHGSQYRGLTYLMGM